MSPARRAGKAASPAPAAVPWLRLEGLVVAYGARAALDGVTLEFPPGSFAAVLGPNGAGKTTLIRALTGRVRPRVGRIECGGTDLERLSPRALARAIAVVPQDLHVPFDYTVLELVLMGRAPRLGLLGWEGAEDLRIARAALERLDLAPLRGRSLHTLSAGERQRVLLARALAQETPVLLLDEPTAHLDLAHQRETLSLLAELHREGKTVLAVLHDPNLASAYCPRLVLLRGGRVAADGAAGEVLTEARMREIYGAVVVARHPQSGGPVVLPAVPGLDPARPGRV